MLSALSQATGGGEFGRGHESRAAADPASGPGRRNAGSRTLDDDLPLELGERRKDVENEPPARRGGVDPLLERAQAHTALPQIAHQVDQVPDRAAEPVQAPHDEGVAMPQVVQKLC